MVKIIRSIINFLFIISSLVSTQIPASAATLSGTIRFTINGTLTRAGTGGTVVSCSGFAVLIPSTNSGMTLSNQIPGSWISGAYQSANAKATQTVQGINGSSSGSSVTGNPATISGPNPNPGTATGFTCVVNIPYTFTNASNTPSSQNIAVIYKVKANDNGIMQQNTINNSINFVPGSYPGGSTTQTVQIQVPGNANVTVNVTL